MIRSSEDYQKSCHWKHSHQTLSFFFLLVFVRFNIWKYILILNNFFFGSTMFAFFFCFSVMVFFLHGVQNTIHTQHAHTHPIKIHTHTHIHNTDTHTYIYSQKTKHMTLCWWVRYVYCLLRLFRFFVPLLSRADCLKAKLIRTLAFLRQ